MLTVTKATSISQIPPGYNQIMDPDLALMGYYRVFDSHLIGGVDNDQLSGGYGNAQLIGNGGDDILVGGNGNDWLEGGAGNDWLIGGDGHDTASYIHAGASVEVDLANHVAFEVPNLGSPQTPNDHLFGIEQVNGSAFDDGITGDSAANDLYGYDGADYLDGAAGKDNLFGMEGNDYVHGGTGDDTIDGGAGNDYLYGDDNNDAIKGGAGDDDIYGGAGDDTVNGDAGSDLVYGGAGSDWEYGGSGKDYLRGDDGEDYLFGEAGDDNVAGGNNADFIAGGAGNDRLWGDGGADELWGEAGNDELHGDGTALATADLFAFDVFGNNGNDTVLDFDVGHDILRFQGVDHLGSAGVTIDHTANGWLQLDFAGGGTATFTGNEQLANVTTMTQLNNLVDIHFDNWNT